MSPAININSAPSPLISSAAPAPTGPQFAAVTPNTLAHNTPYQGTISGSGFTATGINFIFADNGVGENDGYPATIVDDGHVTFGFNGGTMTVPGVYTVYYSTDGGATRAATGLTITST